MSQLVTAKKAEARTRLQALHKQTMEALLARNEWLVMHEVDLLLWELVLAALRASSSRIPISSESARGSAGAGA